MLKDGDGIGCEELLPFANTNDKRRFSAGGNDAARLAAVHHDERPLPMQPREDGRNRKPNVALVGIFDQVGDHLGVDLARKGVALRRQFSL